MPKISHLFFRAGILFLITGIGLGLAMSISQNHDVIGAHAHINLLGWVTSAIFGGYYALNPAKAEGRLPQIHFWVYTAGVALMSAALYLLLKGTIGEPFVAIGSLLTAAGVLIGAYVSSRPRQTPQPACSPPNKTNAQTPSPPGLPGGPSGVKRIARTSHLLAIA